MKTQLKLLDLKQVSRNFFVSQKRCQKFMDSIINIFYLSSFMQLKIHIILHNFCCRKLSLNFFMDLKKNSKAQKYYICKKF